MDLKMRVKWPKNLNKIKIWENWNSKFYDEFKIYWIKSNSPTFLIKSFLYIFNTNIQQKNLKNTFFNNKQQSDLIFWEKKDFPRISIFFKYFLRQNHKKVNIKRLNRNVTQKKKYYHTKIFKNHIKSHKKNTKNQKLF